ncbi:MAG: hypothetical protein MUO76_08625, partial [Anaerolineaceae bacterium]|nr:hypothetical protein [Anaerolineaceae bacterium]
RDVKRERDCWAKVKRLHNQRMVCPESYRLLLGESPILVTVRRSGSRHPVQLGDLAVLKRCNILRRESKITARSIK